MLDVQLITQTIVLVAEKMVDIAAPRLNKTTKAFNRSRKVAPEEYAPTRRNRLSISGVNIPRCPDGGIFVSL